MATMDTDVATMQALPTAPPQPPPQEPPNPAAGVGWGGIPTPVSAPAPAPAPAQQAPAPAPAQPPPAAIPTGGQQPPAPAPSPTPSATPPAATSGATQAVPTTTVQPLAASEPIQPKAEISRPIIDPRPLKYLEMHDPKKYDLVMQIANDVGISPTRLAAHWHHESSFSTDTNLRNKEGSGAMGPMQIMPNTAKELSEGGKFNVNNFVDHMRMGANYIRQGDDKYGRDTVSSVAYYQAGPGNVSAITGDKERAERQHPETFKYLRAIYHGQDIKADQFIGDGRMTAQGLVRAGTEGGHDAFVQYIAKGAPDGMPMSDAWQHAEGLLTKAFLMKGDIAGAQHARDFVLQMSHTGSNQYLMEAHQALSAGDPVRAANALAKSHMFFPDGTAGQFGITGNGQLWGMRVDEHDSKRVLSKFQITPEHIAGMLNQTRDPHKYLKTLNEQQKTAIEGRRADALGEHYKTEERQGDERIAAERARLAESTRQHGVSEAGMNRRGDQADARLKAQQEQDAIRNENTAKDIQLRADAERRKQEHETTLAEKTRLAELDKEIQATYGPDSDVAKQSPQARATMGDVHKEIRKQGAHSVAAESVAKGLQKGGPYQLQKQADGRFGVVPRGAPGAAPSPPVYYLSPGLGARLMPTAPSQAVPTEKKPSVAVP